jgi:hypothetical protein
MREMVAAAMLIGIVGMLCVPAYFLYYWTMRKEAERKALDIEEMNRRLDWAYEAVMRSPGHKEKKEFKGMGKQERMAEKAYRRVLRAIKRAGSSEEVRELARRVERAHLAASGAGATGCGRPGSAVEREAARLRLESLAKDPPAHLPEWLREELGRVLRAWPARDGQEPAGKEPEEC